MSKKLLKESTIRRFGGLAGIRPASTSNFLKEFDDSVYMREEEGEELEVVDGVELELPPEEEEIEDVELDFEEPVEAEGDAEGLVISLLDKVKEWAIDQGVEMDVEADEDVEDVLDFEEPLGDPLEEPVEDVDIEFEEEEDGLEEMINSILSEDDEEGELEEERDWGGKTGDCKGQSTPECREKTKKDYESQSESIKVVSDDKVIQEVTKRVKQRLARIAKARKRQ